MSAIEDRLREAYQGAAATVPPGSLRGVPAAGPAPVGGRRLAVLRREPAPRQRRLLAAVAAAAAVTAIAVTAVAVPQLLSGHGGGGGTASAGAGRPARFFLADGKTDELDVYSAATGRLTGVVRPPTRGTALDSAAGTGNDRVFIVPVTGSGSCGTTALYRLQLTAAGQAAGLTRLPVTRITGSVTALASSADGQTVAYATETCAPGTESAGVIGVVRTHGGLSRHWGWNPDPGQSIGSLSISADGKLIEYAASPNKIINQSEGQTLPVAVIRLLPADAAPGTAAQRSRAVVRIQTVAPGADWTSAVIAPSGQAVYFCTEDDQSSAHPAAVLRAYGIASGATSVLRTFGRGRSQGCMLGASAGDLLILRDITSTPSSVQRYDPRTGQVSRVPVHRSIDEVTSSVPW